MVGRTTAPNAPVSAVQRAAMPGKPEADPPDDALRECEAKLAFASGILRAQEHEKIGDPVPFPDGLAPQYGPEGFEDAVSEAMRACPDSGLHLARVDCSEYPCMAFFTQPENSWNHAIEDLRSCAAWRDQFGKMGGQANDSFMTDDGVVEFSMASVSAEQELGEMGDQNSTTRWTNRLDQGKQALMAELDGRDFTPIEQIDEEIEFWQLVGHDELVPELQARRAKLVAEAAE
jgi:hypothetical protein